NDPGSNSLLILGAGFASAPVHNVVGTYTHTFGPTLLNEVRFGTRSIALFNGSAFNSSIGNPVTELGLSSAKGHGACRTLRVSAGLMRSGQIAAHRLPTSETRLYSRTSPTLSSSSVMP